MALQWSPYLSPLFQGKRGGSWPIFTTQLSAEWIACKYGAPQHSVLNLINFTVHASPNVIYVRCRHWYTWRHDAVHDDSQRKIQRGSSPQTVCWKGYLPLILTCVFAIKTYDSYRRILSWAIYHESRYHISVLKRWTVWWTQQHHSSGCDGFNDTTYQVKLWRSLMGDDSKKHSINYFLNYSHTNALNFIFDSQLS